MKSLFLNTPSVAVHPDEDSEASNMAKKILPETCQHSRRSLTEINRRKAPTFSIFAPIGLGRWAYFRPRSKPLPLSVCCSNPNGLMMTMIHTHAETKLQSCPKTPFQPSRFTFIPAFDAACVSFRPLHPSYSSLQTFRGCIAAL